MDIPEAAEQFNAKMKDNRPNCDDAGMARGILADPLYQRGVPIAKAICVAIYGRVLPRED
jgi:hypothetical protein